MPGPLHNTWKLAPELEPEPSSIADGFAHVNSPSFPAVAVGNTAFVLTTTSLLEVQPLIVLVTTSVYVPGKLTVGVACASFVLLIPGPVHK